MKQITSYIQSKGEFINEIWFCEKARDVAAEW